MNQESSGEYVSCTERIGVVGCPGAVDNSKTGRLPSVKLSHIELYWCSVPRWSVLSQ